MTVPRVLPELKGVIVELSIGDILEVGESIDEGDDTKDDVIVRTLAEDSVLDRVEIEEKLFGVVVGTEGSDDDEPYVKLTEDDTPGVD